MAGDVEFLPEEFSDDQPAGPAPAETRRLSPWWRSIVLATVVLAFVAWVATRPSDTKQPKASRPTTSVATTSAPSPSRVVAALPLHVSTRTVTCPTGVPVQTDIRQAMSRYLPSVVINYPTSYQCNRGIGIDQRIVFETVQGRYRGLVITVALTTPMPGGVPVFAPASPGRRLVLLDRVLVQSVGVKVEITASGRPGGTAPETRMRALAGYLGTNIRL
jgi:hypothetical protein